MKKNVYQAPEMEVVEMKAQSALLQASGEIGGGGSDTFAPGYEPEE